MGKYMRRRKCGGGGGAAGGSEAAPAAGVLGARTRSRAATTAVVVSGPAPAKRRKQAATAARAVDEALSGHDGGGGAAAAGCYLHLRSRRLFMPAAAVAVAPRGDLAANEPSTAGTLADSGASREAVAIVGISRCSSTASSTVDAAARERTGGEAENSPSSRDVESSVSDSSEQRGGRERRETTPSSRPPVDFGDLESSQPTEEQERKRRRSPATTTMMTTAAAFRLESRATMPAAAEIEEFFAAAEKAQAERFAAKYNFDVALGVPLNAGRFEWTPVATA